MPGISDSSKKIKKDKKKSKKNDRSSSNSKALQGSGKEAGEAKEEGEEEDVNTDQLNMDTPFDIDEKPHQYLADQFERFPLYLELKISQNPHFFEYLKPFNPANVFAIENLSLESKEDILVKVFPMVIRIYLIPELNIMTIEFRNENLGTDDVLSNLTLNDNGK